MTLGTGARPAATGNLTFSVFPTSKLTITNSTAVYNVRTEGNSEFFQLNGATGGIQTVPFQYLGIRTLSNQTDLNYQAVKWLSFFGGYHYSDRLIVAVLDPTVPAFDQTSILNAGVFGVRIRPVQGVTVMLDGEVGRANQPFTPKSDGNYQALGARVQYKHKSLLLSANAQSNYNNNSITLTAYSSHSRTYAANASWTPLRWLSFTADYSKLHLDTLGGLSFFDNGNLTPEPVLPVHQQSSDRQSRVSVSCWGSAWIFTPVTVTFKIPGTVEATLLARGSAPRFPNFRPRKRSRYASCLRWGVFL